MTEETKPFTVSDRRHFTPEGSVRDEASPEPAENRQSEAASGLKAEDDGGMDAPVEFSSFLLSLGAQAAGLLVGAGERDDRRRRLREARALISVIEMLKDKTEGRRTEDEERVTLALLYELRMTYVSAARVDGA
jgi:hypothetical protein